ncbi:DUF2797 domain-containing protein [Candidatus Peregrinibacteria bacterium]|nr:DUF2797 domain-containing protein [Candidatus Peregrinibacteria bacterium]
MPHRIFDFQWKDEKTPQFLCSKDGKLEEKKLVFGENLTLSITSGIKCAGYEKNGVWNPCPHENVGSRKCPDCKQKEGLSVAQFCDGDNLGMFSSEDLEKLQTPHYLYLALFQKDMFKVGVSSVSRGYLRQMEQGTHFALILAEGMGGILARQAEKFLTKCGIPDKILSSQKKEFLFPDISEEEGKRVLLSAIQKYIPALLHDRPEIKSFLKEPCEFLNFENYFHLQDAKNCQKPLHAISLKLGDILSGKVLSVKGSFLVMETDREKIILNAKDLFGFEIDFIEKPLGMILEKGFQSAMF